MQQNLAKTKKTTRKIIGYILVLIGILLPLYGFTSISFIQWTARSDYESFIKEQQERSQQDLVAEENESKKYNEGLGKEVPAIVDPFEAEGYKAVYNVDIDKDAVFAYLRIPSLQIERPIYLDATNEHLSKGVAQIDGTALPIGGLGTRSVIAGHRGYYSDTIFLYLAEIKEGDSVFVDRAGQSLEYRVVGREIIKPSEWEKLKPDANKDLLTLLTCDPFAPPRPDRLLIHCERVIDEQSTEDIADLKSETNNSSLVKMSYYGIYGITIIGWLLFIFVLFKFIKFLRKH